MSVTPILLMLKKSNSLLARLATSLYRTSAQSCKGRSPSDHIWSFLPESSVHPCSRRNLAFCHFVPFQHTPYSAFRPIHLPTMATDSQTDALSGVPSSRHASDFRSLKLLDLHGEEQRNAAIPLGPPGSIFHGQLDNGLSYYVRKNAKPKERAALALAVKIGYANVAVRVDARLT